MTIAFIEPAAISPVAATTSADRDLQDRVILFIKQRQLARGADLKVLAHRGVITLLGIVPTFYQRQLLHSQICRVAGVVLVQDELEVASPADTDRELTTLSSPSRRPSALAAC